MAVLMTGSTNPNTLAVMDDNMEISSDAGRQNFIDDDEIDIDVEFDINQPYVLPEDSMIDDDGALPRQDTHDVIHFTHDDEMVDDQEYEDAGMREEQVEANELYKQDEELVDINIDLDQEGDTDIAGNSFIDEHYGEHSTLIEAPVDVLPNEVGDKSPAHDMHEAARTNIDQTVNKEEFASMEEQQIKNASNGTLATNSSDVIHDINEENQILETVFDDDEESFTRAQDEIIDEHQHATEPVEDVFAVNEDFPREESARIIDELREPEQAAQQVADHEVVSGTLLGSSILGSDKHLDHPVMVEFNGQEMSLFPVGQEAKITSVDFLLENRAMISENMRDLLGSCRSALGESITDNEDLEVTIAELELSVSEDSNQASHFSLLEVLEVYVQLCQHDGNDSPAPLHLYLCSKPRFVSRMIEIIDANNAGLGLSKVIVPARGPEHEDFDYDEGDFDGPGIDSHDSDEQVAIQNDGNYYEDVLPEIIASQSVHDQATNDPDISYDGQTEPIEDRGVAGEEEFLEEDLITLEDPDLEGDPTALIEPASELERGSSEKAQEVVNSPNEDEVTANEGQDDLLDYSADEDEADDEAQASHSSSGSATVQGDQVTADEADRSQQAQPDGNLALNIEPILQSDIGNSQVDYSNEGIEDEHYDEEDQIDDGQIDDDQIDDDQINDDQISNDQIDDIIDEDELVEHNEFLHENAEEAPNQAHDDEVEDLEPFHDDVNEVAKSGALDDFNNTNEQPLDAANIYPEKASRKRSRGEANNYDDEAENSEDSNDAKRTRAD